jgi:hypothetical protein
MSLTNYTLLVILLVASSECIAFANSWSLCSIDLFVFLVSGLISGILHSHIRQLPL